MVTTNTTVKKVRKSTKADTAVPVRSTDELANMLDNTEVQYASFSRLFIGELNARKVPHSEAELREYADTIRAVGLIHNLIVVACDDERLEVVCGGGRTKAIGLLVAEGAIDPDKVWIAYKVVPRELARAVSQIENDKRKNMHPADQIKGFMALSEEGKSPSQIGALLGYGAKHVQRMLKLAGLAPEIISALAKDELTTEHCQALALESNQERQLQILESARQEGYQGVPRVVTIRGLVTTGEVSTNNDKFAFVGEAAFAEGEIRHDLFSEREGGFVDYMLLEAKVMEKLQQAAEDIQATEGWSWSLARTTSVKSYGEDSKLYSVMDEPQPVYTQDEQNRLDELTEQYEALDSFCEESQALEDAITGIQLAGESRAWEDVPKTELGIVVSYDAGCVRVQRGVMLKTPEQETETGNATLSGSLTQRTPEVAEGIGGPLLLKMSSERTLAAQAALLQEPEKAVAMLAWKLCISVFSTCSTANEPFEVRINTHHYTLTADAPSGKSGAAYLALMKEEARLKALLPQGWKNDFTTFFTLNAELLLALMTFCTACSVNGVQKRDEFGRKGASPLESLESAIGFHMRDWWQPTKENFFSHMQKPQIVTALNEAGMTGAAGDAEKMKKGDAADLAQDKMANTRWVPSWMCAKASETTPSETHSPELNVAASESTDTTEHTSAEAA